MTMKPALTSEEWRLVAECAPRPIDTYVGDTPGACHYVAALNLYGQAFGFTHEDVKEIRDTADSMEAEFGEQVAERVAQLRSLAERVEALLPPVP